MKRSVVLHKEILIRVLLFYSRNGLSLSVVSTTELSCSNDELSLD
jgi:hypothetical protein